MLKLIDAQSAPTCKSETDLFSVPPTEVSIEKGHWFAAYPTNTLKNEGPFDFRINADPHYIQLAKNYLFMKIKITKDKGENLAADGTTDKVGPINLIGKTLFRQVKVFIGGKLVSDSGDLYAYRSYMETHLNFGSDAKNTHLGSCLYVKDEPSDKVDSKDNEGWKLRVKPFINSSEVELMAPIHSDLFASDRLLLSHTDVRLELHRNSDAFVLTTFVTPAHNYKLKIVDMIWYIRRVELSSSLNIALETALSRTPAKYPIRRVEMTHIHVGGGSTQTPNNVLFNGQLPRRVIVGCVSTDAFYGSYTTSPFNFNNFTITEVKLTAGGVTFPREPLKTDFTRMGFTRAFVQLNETLDIARQDKGCDINMLDFQNSSCFFAFDLTADECDSGHWTLIREGSTSLDIRFGTAPPGNGLEVIVFAEFDNLITIDRNRNVFYDFNA